MYHYTNEQGAIGILYSGYIYESNYAIHGEGVYLTDLPPCEGKETILLNNYGRTTIGQGLEKDRADWCFKFLTFELFEACYKNVKCRIIWKYPDNIPIYNHWFASGRTEENELSYKVHRSPSQYDSFPPLQSQINSLPLNNAMDSVIPPFSTQNYFNPVPCKQRMCPPSVLYDATNNCKSRFSEYGHNQQPVSQSVPAECFSIPAKINFNSGTVRKNVLFVLSFDSFSNSVFLL